VRIETLTRMAQQIARNNQALPADEGAERVATHLRSFWTPVMLAELSAYAADNADELDPLVIAALGILGERAGA